MSTVHASPLRRGALRCGLAVTLVLAAAACAHRPEPAIYVYPGESWAPVSSAEAAGWPAQGLEAVREKLQTMATTGFMAVVGGRVLMEYGNTDTVTYLASDRKSVLSMLYGMYVHNGTIRLDKTLAELGIDDHQGLTDQEKQATIRDIISARSGVYHPASNPGDNLAQAPPRGSQKPGTYYLYSNWDFNVAGAIFEQETAKNIYDALQEHLAVPLEFQDWNRSIHRKSGNLQVSRHPAYHMHLSTRDMARIGYLMLREGNWKGREIVPREWVRQSTSVVTPRLEMNPPERRRGPFGYGYMWWVFDNPELPDVYRGGYTASGAVGQYIMVLPRLDLVIAHKTAPGRRRSVSGEEFREVVSLLIQARCPGGICR